VTLGEKLMSSIIQEKMVILIKRADIIVFLKEFITGG